MAGEAISGTKSQLMHFRLGKREGGRGGGGRGMQLLLATPRDNYLFSLSLSLSPAGKSSLFRGQGCQPGQRRSPCTWDKDLVALELSRSYLELILGVSHPKQQFTYEISNLASLLRVPQPS